MSETGHAGGCAVKPAIPASARKVVVNGVVISRAEIAREAQNHPAASPAAAMEEAARALGLAALPDLDEEGRRETDDEALIRVVLDAQAPAQEPTGEECRRYYDGNRGSFRSAPLYEVSHILVAAPPADREARVAALGVARALFSDLAERPDQFAELACARSACPSAANGGNLGQIGPGQTVPEFESALAGMLPGRVHPEPVESRYGFHVVRVDRKIEGKEIPFELAKPRISAWLADKARRTALRRYLTQIACRADIEGVALPGLVAPAANPESRQ